jgi:hypothetical protein
MSAREQRVPSLTPTLSGLAAFTITSDTCNTTSKGPQTWCTLTATLAAEAVSGVRGARPDRPGQPGSLPRAGSAHDFLNDRYAANTGFTAPGTRVLAEAPCVSTLSAV